jgi:hypothetical protein
MVHALKEAYRILVPQGILIDVRPLSVNVPLEVIYKGGSESAGILDLRPERDSDIAADRAIESVLMDQIYKELMLEYFDFTYYWKTIKDMKADLEEYWKDDVIVPPEVFQQARMLFKKRHPQTKIRVGVQMKLGKYEKLSS